MKKEDLMKRWRDNIEEMDKYQTECIKNNNTQEATRAMLIKAVWMEALAELRLLSN